MPSCTKAEPVSTLLDALRRLARGRRLLEPPSPELLEAAVTRLDERDLPVLALLVQRASAPDIAHALGLDEEEVRRRTRRIVGVLQADRPCGSPLSVS
jgi:DNA-binding NarL/FixJ family response regulator